MMVQHERFVELVKFAERERLVVQSPHEVWSQIQRPVEPFQRFLVPAELLQSGTDVVAYVGIGWIQHLCLSVVGQRFLKSIQPVQRRAAPVQGRGVIRLQFVAQV